VSIAEMVVGRRPSLDGEVGRLSDLHASVSRKQGDLLYLIARSTRAARIVEFGTSVGISATFLAAAVRDNGGGRVIGSELNSHKHATACRNLTEAGLSDLVEIRQGDALDTLREPDGPIDMVFLDGFPAYYLPILTMLAPRLRQGAVVVADNILTHRAILAPYRQFVRDEANGFFSATLLVKYGMEYSIRL
jgi:predicted O-methyltransferase YrrM